jgi:hypothetical protein
MAFYCDTSGLFYCIPNLRPDILGERMSTVQEIKQAVRKLPLSKRLQVVKWVTKFDNDEWDKEMAKDAATGKLDFLVQEGKEALKKGQLKSFPRT